jgi:8-oxo-dGTP diphosphatase
MIDSINPRVGVGIIITRNNQVLLLKRLNVHGAGSWSTPGGHLEFGETPEECATREAKEETNLDIDNITFKSITNDVFIAENKHYITIWMQGENNSGKEILAAAYESSEIGWFDWDKLPQPLFLPLQNLLNGDSYPKPKHG